MAKYVDGYVLPIPKKRLAAYQSLAKKAGKIWKEHGALEYKECAGDDMRVKCGVPLPKLLKLKRGEIVIFAFVVYKSRAHRDKVNAKVMADPRLKEMCSEMSVPFNPDRMSYGGFDVIVDI